VALRKDYYVILGIPRGESAAGIHSAYRDLAKRHHTDVAGPSGTGRFREIAEAHKVLSDPAQRRQYDADLTESETAPSTGILRWPVESSAPQPLSFFDLAGSIRPSFDELFERYFRNFTGYGVPKAEREEGLNIEVLLTPEEASRGGVLPVTVPVFHDCPACRGTGEDWFFPCLECHAQGLIEQRETIRINIPPGIRPPAVFELPLRGLGIHNFYLRVHVMIGND
jgi:DnaJ-class molecular chaperone